jgi:hypothetical protein
VPDRFAGTRAADRHTVFDDVRHHMDFRHAVGDALPVFLYRRIIKLAEPARECDQVVIAYGLVTQQ